MALSSTLVRTLGFQPGKFGSTPNRATNGGYGLITALGHSDFLLLIGSNPIASTKNLEGLK